MGNKRSAAARMTQQMNLNCVDCGARAFYGSTRGSVCAEHKWGKKQATNKAGKVHRKQRRRIDWQRD
jgi:hypothetical protein